MAALEREQVVGRRPVSRWTRPFTVAQNATQAAARSAKLAYAPSRFASVGTRSALATLTVLSLPPLLSGSKGTQALTSIP